MLKDSNAKRLITALIIGVLSSFAYKLYVYVNNKEQFEDSNLLVSLLFVLIVAALAYMFLGLLPMFSAKRKH